MIPDDRIPDARVMFGIVQCIYPKFDYMGVFGAVHVEIWENGICTAVIEAAVSESVARVTPNDRGGRWSVPAPRLSSGWWAGNVVEVDPTRVASYECVCVENLKL